MEKTIKKTAVKQPIVKKTRAKKLENQQNEEINVKLSDEQIDKLYSYKDERAVVFSIYIISFDLSFVDLLKKKIKVTVLLCGIPVGDVILTQDAFEQSIGPNIGIAKASITISVNWEISRVDYKASACVRNSLMKWKCKKLSGTAFKL
jgi:hypothetical protein